MASWNETQWGVVNALSDAYVTSLSLAEIDTVNPESSAESHRAVANLPASRQPGFRDALIRVTGAINPAKIKLFGLILNLLAYRASAVALTASPKLITEMSIKERTALIKYWASSPIWQLKMLASQLCDMAMFGWMYGNPSVLEAMGYELRNPTYEKFVEECSLFVPRMIQNCGGQKFDIVIIGSGCGGGVVASIAARAGFSVLVVEKANYVSPKDTSENPSDVEVQAFEQAGRVMSDDASMSILSGSALGGGGAINWSCSLKTPQDVRREWAKEVPWYGSTEYDDAMDYVFEEMQVTTDFGEHSFTNQLIIDSCAKLDYPVKVAGQNTGKHLPNNRYKGWGYRSGTKGGISVWLEKASEAGAVVAASALASRIVRRGNKATGVELVIDGAKVFVEAKRVVASGGSLSTPGLLLRSGFKNKHVGRHLKLHPASAVFGDFDEVVNRNDDTVMTTVCSHFANRDGNFHGPRLEALHTIPHLMGKFMPWKDGKDNAANFLRYSHLSTVLVLVRDKDEGRVYLDKSRPFAASVEYTPSKFDLESLHVGAVEAAKLLYVGGARRILMPASALPYFVSDRPKEARRLNDSDFQHWLRKCEAHEFKNYGLGVGTAHQMGSCRMSARGAKYGAVDANGRLWECRNVHVADASVFPTASGVNPMISTLSTAKVLADRLVKDLQRPSL